MNSGRLDRDRISEIAQDLYEHISGQFSIAWIGSGLSEDTRYPPWPNLINRLCNVCEIEPLPPDEINDPSSLISKAEECKQAHEENYWEELHEIFSNEGRALVTRQEYLTLVQLPFNGYITTNFDPILSSVFGLRPIRNLGITEELFTYPKRLPPAHLGREEKSVFYIHGYGPNENELVLAESDFDKAYDRGDKSTLYPFLEQILLDSPILFLGCRLEEPDVKETFKRIRKTFFQNRDLNEPDRFILRHNPTRDELVNEDPELEKYEAEELQSRIEDEKANIEDKYDKLGIEVVWYSSTDYHVDVSKILEEVLDLVQPGIQEG